MNKNKSFIIIFIFVALITFFVVQSGVEEKVNIKYVTLAGAKLHVLLAVTPKEQTQGLSGRNTLAKDQGMLFVFEHPDRYSFWMKDMNFPIDIIWINENRKVVYIKKNAAPKDFPETYEPTDDAKYILEVVSGFSDKNNLKVGDSVLLE